MKEYIIKEFEDLLNLLRERPDYLEKLRVLILTKELLELPIKFEEFRNEVNRRFDEVDKRFEEVDKRFEESDRKFEEFRSEVNRRLEALEKGQEEIKERQQRMEERQDRMEEILERHEKSIQELKGWQLEHKVFINICSYLGSYIGIRKCKIKDKSELFDELDEYVEKGIISQEKENKEILERVYKKKVIPLIVGKEISKKLKVKLKNLNVNFVLVKK